MIKHTRIATWVKILALTHMCGNTIAGIYWASNFSGNPAFERSGLINASTDDNGTCAMLECSSAATIVDVAFIWAIIINGGTVVATIVACIGWSPERHHAVLLQTVDIDTKETVALLYDVYFGSGCILHDYSYEVKHVKLGSRRRLRKHRRS